MSLLKKMVKGHGTKGLVLNQKLNKLFYLPAKPEEETEMILAQCKQDRVRTGLHLSAIMASKEKFCYREQVLSQFYMMCQGESVPQKLMQIFKAGTFIGEKWQRLFIRGGLGGPNDMDISRFHKEYNLSYTPDATIEIDGIKYIVEIKSQNTFGFGKDEGHPSGQKQLRMYMYFDEVKHGFVLVEDKNTQAYKIIHEAYGETFDYSDISEYIARLEQIVVLTKKFKDKKKAPKRICETSTCKRAEECSMRDACFNIGMGRVKLDT